MLLGLSQALVPTPARPLARVSPGACTRHPPGPQPTLGLPASLILIYSRGSPAPEKLGTSDPPWECFKKSFKTTHSLPVPQGTQRKGQPVGLQVKQVGNKHLSLIFCLLPPSFYFAKVSGKEEKRIKQKSAQKRDFCIW